MSQTEASASSGSIQNRAASPVSRQDVEPAVVELRQYTLHPGGRETLIGLFDGHFVEPQEEAGMTVIGQFRDLDRPDMFVWLRGFPDMEGRRNSLATFYGGPIWAAHRDAANATMIDSDDVLLLKPAWENAGFGLTGVERPAPASSASGSPSSPDGAPGVFMATIWHPGHAAEDDFVERFRREAAPLLGSLGAPLTAAFATDHAENTFPRLPVRANENVFVAFTRFSDMAAVERHDSALAGSGTWRSFLASVRHGLTKPTERLRLSPTARSRLR